MGVVIGDRFFYHPDLIDLTALNIWELAHYKDYIRACLTKLPDSPVLQSKLEAIEREVRWRAEDTKF
jgi:hypothetical protein